MPIILDSIYPVLLNFQKKTAFIKTNHLPSFPLISTTQLSKKKFFTKKYKYFFSKTIIFPQLFLYICYLALRSSTTLSNNPTLKKTTLFKKIIYFLSKIYILSVSFLLAIRHSNLLFSS